MARAREIEKKLTNRQWRTIALLKVAFERDPSEWVTQKEIVEFTPAEEFVGGYSKSESTSHDQCAGVWTDIKFINDSGEFDTIIIYKDFKAKLATYEEAKEYIEYLRSKAMKLLDRMAALNRELHKNNCGQMVEDTTDLKFVQSVLKENEQWS